jgi:hypothetical protein
MRNQYGDITQQASEEKKHTINHFYKGELATIPWVYKRGWGLPNGKMTTDRAVALSVADKIIANNLKWRSQ